MTTRKKIAAMRDYLKELGEKNGGRLTSNIVLKDAKRKTSPLHGCFDWDNDTAARKWRIHQARKLIDSVEYNFTFEKRSYKASYYVRDPSVEANEQGYVSIPTLRTDEELAREALVEAFKLASSHLEKAHELARALSFNAKKVERIVKQTRSLYEEASRAF